MKKNFVKKCLSFVFMFGIFAFAMLLSGCGAETNEVRVDGIEISKKNMYLAEGQTAVISAQVFPFNANNQNYTFESSNNSVVTCEDGFVIAKKAGDAVISVYSEEGGYKDDCNVLVTKAGDNLELNNFNNLNMPPKELQPIYNSEDQQTTQTNAIPVENSSPTLARIKEYATKRVNSEIQNDIEAGKDVLSQIKDEFKLFVDDLDLQKNMIKNMYSGGQNALFDAFNNLHNTMIDEMQKTNQAMIDQIDDLKQKVSAGEYAVESKEINGVTFVVISNKSNINDNA